MIAANNEPTATANTNQGTQTGAALADQIIARRAMFEIANDVEADRLADEEEGDLCSLATARGALAGKARVLLATNMLRYISPSFGEWRVLESLLRELAAPNVI